MHVATMVLLIVIAVIGLAAAFTAPQRLGKTPAYITVGTGLRTVIIMGMILLWLIWFGAGSDDHLVRLITAIMVAERSLGLIRYAGWIGQTRTAHTWQRVSVAMFWGLTEVALATTLLIFAW